MATSVNRHGGLHPVPAVNWKLWLGIGVAIVALALGGFFVVSGRGREEPSVEMPQGEQPAGAVAAQKQPTLTATLRPTEILVSTEPPAQAPPRQVWPTPTLAEVIDLTTQVVATLAENGNIWFEVLLPEGYEIEFDRSDTRVEYLEYGTPSTEYQISAVYTTVDGKERRLARGAVAIPSRFEIIARSGKKIIFEVHEP